MSKKEKKQENNLYLLIIAILLLSIFIVGIEVFSVNRSNREKEKKLSKSAYMDETTTTKKNEFYDTSNLVFTQIDLTNEYKIKDICLNGCNLKIKESNLEFILKKNNGTGEYLLDLVDDSKAIFENKKIGTSVDEASLLNYGNLKTLKMKIRKDEYYYDYALFIDQDKKIDEISSLNANEMEFLENGIVYYYDVCSDTIKGSGKKVKAVRAPFSDKPAIISSTDATFSWCD